MYAASLCLGIEWPVSDLVQGWTGLPVIVDQTVIFVSNCVFMFENRVHDVRT